MRLEGSLGKLFRLDQQSVLEFDEGAMTSVFEFLLRILFLTCLWVACNVDCLAIEVTRVEPAVIPFSSDTLVDDDFVGVY